MTRTERIDFCKRNARACNNIINKAAYLDAAAKFEAMTDAEFEAGQDAANEKAMQHASDHPRRTGHTDNGGW